MNNCPTCGTPLVRIRSSRLDRLIAIPTGLRPHICPECSWRGRRRPAPGQRRRRRSLRSTTPHRRCGEAITDCPVCDYGSVVRLESGVVDRVLALATGRVRHMCLYCGWRGRRRPSPDVPSIPRGFKPAFTPHVGDRRAVVPASPPAAADASLTVELEKLQERVDHAAEAIAEAQTAVVVTEPPLSEEPRLTTELEKLQDRVNEAVDQITVEVDERRRTPLD